MPTCPHLSDEETEALRSRPLPKGFTVKHGGDDPRFDSLHYSVSPPLLTLRLSHKTESLSSHMTCGSRSKGAETFTEAAQERHNDDHNQTLDIRQLPAQSHLTASVAQRAL